MVVVVEWWLEWEGGWNMAGEERRMGEGREEEGRRVVVLVVR